MFVPIPPKSTVIQGLKDRTTQACLARELVARLERGAWIGAANFLMFLYHREAGSGVMLKALHDAHTARYPLI